MEFIDKNFPNFREANPELTIKLFVLMFLNICADNNGNEEKEEEYKKLMEMGKKAKELLAEVGENMEDVKFRKLSRETEVNNFITNNFILISFLFSGHFLSFFPTLLMNWMTIPSAEIVDNWPKQSKMH